MPLLLIVLSLTGCEPSFVGNRALNITDLNAPLEMQQVELGAAADPYLVVASTNSFANFQTGAIQFFSLANPLAPTPEANLNFSVPSNVVGFYVEPYDADEDRQRLFLLNRNTDKLLVYSRSATGSFGALLNPDGTQQSFDTFSNPVDLEAFSHDGVDYLAIASLSTQTIQFFDRTNFRMLNAEVIEDQFGLRVSGYRSDREGKAGALLEGIAREDLGGNFRDEIRGVSSLGQAGAGIGKILSLPSTAESVLVGVNFLDTIVHGFWFRDFDNAANVAWELTDSQNGFESGGVDFEGTREVGFRGADVDNQNRVYLSSRSDNGIYRVTASVFQTPRQDLGQDRNPNTFALNQNKTTATGIERLNLEIEDADNDDSTVRTDKFFPRLGDLQVSENGAKVFVMGLADDDRGYSNSRLYSLDATDFSNPSITQVVGFETAFREGSILYWEASNVLYLASSDDSRIYVFDENNGELSLQNSATLQ